MSSLEDIRQSLLSEKVNQRKNGRAMCEKYLLQRQLGWSNVLKTSSQTMGLLNALISWEKHEINAANAKGKPIDRDSIGFFKTMIRYCMKNGQVKSSQVDIVLKPILDLLDDGNIPAYCKVEHKQILIEVLSDPRLTHEMPFRFRGSSSRRGLDSLFIYLKRTITDRSTASDSKNLALLRAVSLCLYKDLDHELMLAEVVLGLLEWMNSLIEMYADNDDAASISIVSCVADCYSALMQFYGLNIINLVISVVSTLLLAIKRYLFSPFLRDLQSESFLTFLHILAESMNTNYPALNLAVSGLSNLEGVCRQMLEDLVSEDYMASFMLSIRNKQTSKRAKEHFLNVLEDQRAVLYYQVIFKYLSFGNKVDKSEFSGSSSASREITKETNEPPMKKIKVNSSQNLSSSSTVPITLPSLFKKLSSMSFVTKDTKKMLYLESMMYLVITSIGANHDDFNLVQIKRSELLLLFHSFLDMAINSDDRSLTGATVLAVNCLLHACFKTFIETRGVENSLRSKSSDFDTINGFALFYQLVISREQRLQKLMQTCTNGSLANELVKLINRALCINASLNCDEGKNQLHQKLVKWRLFITPTEGTTISYLTSIVFLLQTCKDQRFCDVWLTSDPELQTLLEIYGLTQADLIISPKSRSYLAGITWLLAQLQRNNNIANSVLSLPLGDLPLACSLFEQLMLEMLGISSAICLSDYLPAAVQDLASSLKVDWFYARNLHWLINSSWQEEFEQPRHSKESTISRVNFAIVYNSLKLCRDTWKSIVFQGLSVEMSESIKGHCCFGLLLLRVSILLWSKTPKLQNEIDPECDELLQDIWICLELLLRYLQMRTTVSSVGFIAPFTSALNSVLRIIENEERFFKDNGGQCKITLSTMIRWCQGNESNETMPGNSDTITQNSFASDDFEESSFSLKKSVTNIDLTIDTSSATLRAWREVIEMQANCVELMRILRLHSIPITEQSMKDLLAVRHSYNVEGTLWLADRLGQFKQLELFQTLVISSPWNLRWGHLAYGKILGIINNILSSESYWLSIRHIADPIADDNFLHFATNMIFCPEDDDIFQNYLISSSFCRELQMLCTVNILRYCPHINAIKVSVRQLFISSLTDNSFQVRNIAAQNLTLLMKHFSKPANVYNSIISELPFSLLREAAADGDRLPYEDPIGVALVAVSIASMAVAPSSVEVILSSAMVDLIKLCSSRISHHVHEEEKHIYSSLLVHSLEIISRSLGYHSRIDLVKEYLNFLFFEWLAMSPGDDDTVNVETSGYALKSFSFEILLDQNLNNNRRQEFYKDFLIEYRRVIVPLIFQVKSSRKRWCFLIAYCEDSGLGTSDASIAKLVLELLPEAKAIEFYTYFRAKCTDSTGGCSLDDCMMKAKDMQEFLARVTNENVSGALIAENITEFLSAVFLNGTFETIWKYEFIDDAAHREELLSSILRHTMMLLKLQSPSELFRHCNMLELISRLRYRLETSRRRQTCLHILSCVLVIIKSSVAVLNNFLCMSMIMNILHVAVERYLLRASTEVTEAFIIVGDVLSTTFHSVTNTVRNEILRLWFGEALLLRNLLSTIGDDDNNNQQVKLSDQQHIAFDHSFSHYSAEDTIAKASTQDILNFREISVSLSRSMLNVLNEWGQRFPADRFTLTVITIPEMLWDIPTVNITSADNVESALTVVLDVFEHFFEGFFVDAALWIHVRSLSAALCFYLN